jgi:hypothetical protein
MTDGDDKLSNRYRELAREEPSAALDAAILSASREAIAKPSFSRRWGAPVSIAAVLVLAFGLTLERQHEKPGVSTSVPVTPQAPPPASAPMQAPQAEEPRPAKAEAARSAPVPGAQPMAAPKRPAPPAEEKQSSPAANEPAMRDQLQAAPAAAEQFAPSPLQPARAATPSPATATESVRQSAPAANITAPASVAAPPRPPSINDSAPSAPAARAKNATGAVQLELRVPTPEQALERIAKLRADGHDADADRALEEFHRQYPGYRIDDAMWERVKPR